MSQFREVAFIDTGIADIGTLIANLRPGVVPVLLNAAKAALPQMAEILAILGEVDVIHIIAHGRALCGACHTRKTAAERAARLRR